MKSLSAARQVTHPTFVSQPSSVTKLCVAFAVISHSRSRFGTGRLQDGVCCEQHGGSSISTSNRRHSVQARHASSLLCGVGSGSASVIEWRSSLLLPVHCRAMSSETAVGLENQDQQDTLARDSPSPSSDYKVKLVKLDQNGPGENEQLEWAYDQSMRISLDPTKYTEFTMGLNGVSAQAAIDLYTKFKSEGHSFTAHEYSQLLRVFAKNEKYDLALLVLRDAKNDPNITTTSTMYTYVLRACRKASVNLVLQLLKEARSTTVMDNPRVSYLAAIHACMHLRDVETAFLLVKELKKEYGIDPDEFVNNCLISVCNRGDEHDKAMAVYEHMKASKQLLSIHTFTPLLMSCITGGHWERCTQLLLEARQAGVDPTLSHFHIAIQTCIKAKQWDRGTEVFRVAYMNDLYDESLFSLMMELCTVVQPPRFNEASNFFLLMQQKGLLLTHRSYTHVIKCWAQVKSTVECERLWEDMKLKGIKPGGKTLDALYLLYGNTGAVEKLAKLMDEYSEAKGYPPLSRQVFVQLAAACWVSKDPQKALKIPSIMQARNLAPHVSVYMYIIRTLKYSQDWGHALTLYEEGKKYCRTKSDNVWLMVNLAEVLAASGQQRKAQSLVSDIFADHDTVLLVDCQTGLPPQPAVALHLDMLPQELLFFCRARGVGNDEDSMGGREGEEKRVRRKNGKTRPR